MTDSQFDESMLRMQHGEKEPLREIYEDYSGYIYSIIYSVVNSRENAEDLTADFFIKLWDQADKYRPGTGHKAWMSRIAHNLAIDFLRKRRRETLTDEMEATADDDSDGGRSVYDNDTKSSVEEEVVGNMALQQALQSLNEDERAVINMKIMGDLTFKAISEAMGISMGSVTWKYQSAIRKLRKFGYE